MSLQSAVELGKPDFWHNLVIKKTCGEFADVNDNELNEWKESTLSNVLKQYNTTDIYNTHECGLSYRALADKTFF